MPNATARAATASSTPRLALSDHPLRATMNDVPAGTGEAVYRWNERPSMLTGSSAIRPAPVTFASVPSSRTSRRVDASATGIDALVAGMAYVSTSCREPGGKGTSSSALPSVKRKASGGRSPPPEPGSRAPSGNVTLHVGDTAPATRVRLESFATSYTSTTRRTPPASGGAITTCRARTESGNAAEVVSYTLTSPSGLVTAASRSGVVKYATPE